MNASPLTRLFAIATVFAAAAAAAPAALAQTEGTALSREEVKQETRAAMQAGHMLPAGELSAPVHMASNRSREERKAETLAANRNGGLGSPGVALYNGYNVAPRQALAASTKTRADRKAETLQAIKLHQLMPAGEAG
jgi:hypothetical protein